MTPTLRGRVETRLFLLTFLGLPITAIFAWLYQDRQTPFVLLGYVLLFGLAWDGVYYGLQTLRWNRDWPPLFMVVAGVWEAMFLWGLISLSREAGLTLPGVAPGLTFFQFAAHYTVVFWSTFAAAFSLLPILFPRWRYRGGEWSD
ncbi:MAG: hypothetical protein KJ063_16025 [Anaerolineae bacterium]|nr:hypothetical protein [Anaerolineae bacterium]